MVDRKTCLLTCAGILIATALIVVVVLMFNCDKKLNVASLDGFQEEKEPVVIEYFSMEGCQYCRAFDPIWDSVKAEVEATDVGVMLYKYDVGTPEGKAKAAEAGVTAFPHVQKTTPEGDVTVFTGKRDESTLKEFCWL